MEKNNEQPSWQKIGQQKREAIRSLLPADWKIDHIPLPQDLPDARQFAKSLLSPEELEISDSLSAEHILEKISKGELSALQVTKAFCHSAAIAHQLTNCLSEVVFEQAIADAKKLDDAFERDGKVVGPLHGLPVSLKDQFRVRDAETSLGYVAWLGKKESPESESWLVRELRKLGAIVYVKTNVPSSLMAIETNNNIIGYTTNAANRLLSSGGSSGGEAALIAMGGSVVGLGSDVGASIRLPCGYNGIAGLKPSHGRLPYLGVANSMEGNTAVPSVIGPLGRNITDLRLLFKVILQTQPWRADPNVLRLPWRPEEDQSVARKVSSRALVFGVLRCDGVVTPHPPVRRVLDNAVEKIRAHGYQVVDWDPPAHKEGFDIAWDAFTADSGRDIHSVLAESGEHPVPELAASYGERFGNLPEKTVNDLWETQRRKSQFQTAYLRYWENTRTLTNSGEPVDAIIMPVAPTVAFERGKGVYPGYTAVFNVLDYSVAVVRAGKADCSRDESQETFRPLGDLDAMIQQHYNPQLFHGAPIGIQIICRRLEEEKVLGIAREVEHLLGDS